MKKALIAFILFLLPSFILASPTGMSASTTLSSSMTVFSGLVIFQKLAMIFPTAVQGQNPAVWDTTMGSAVAGGVAGQHGVMNVSSSGVGSISLYLSPTTISVYPITFTGVNAGNLAAIPLTNGSQDITLKGTINASATPFAAGTFNATTACTVTYL